MKKSIMRMISATMTIALGIGSSICFASYEMPTEIPPEPASMTEYDQSLDDALREKILNDPEIDDNVKKVLRGEDFVFGEGVPLNLNEGGTPPLQPQWVSGGTNHTHQYITSVALSILKNDQGSNIMSSTYASTIMQGADLPDKDEIGFLFAGHFFDPYTQENFLGSKTDTAFTNFMEHYDEAVSLYSTDRTSAFTELGRALHYLQDVSEPHHASNLDATISNHSEFEKYADEHRASYYTYTMSNDSYEYGLNTDEGSMFFNFAYYAYDFADDAQVTSKYNSVASDTMKKAQRNTACILWRFGNEVGIF